MSGSKRTDRAAGRPDQCDIAWAHNPDVRQVMTCPCTGEHVQVSHPGDDMCALCSLN